MRPYSVSFILGCKIELSKTPASGEAWLYIVIFTKKMIDTVIKYHVCLLTVQKVSNRYLLILQIFVVLKEIPDFLNRVRRDISNIRKCVGRIHFRTRTSNQLGVVALIVACLQTSENNALDVGTGHQFIIHQNNDINRVARGGRRGGAGRDAHLSWRSMRACMRAHTGGVPYGRSTIREE